MAIFTGRDFMQDAKAVTDSIRDIKREYDNEVQRREDYTSQYDASIMDVEGLFDSFKTPLSDGVRQILALQQEVEETNSPESRKKLRQLYSQYSVALEAAKQHSINLANSKALQRQGKTQESKEQIQSDALAKTEKYKDMNFNQLVSSDMLDPNLVIGEVTTKSQVGEELGSISTGVTTAAANILKTRKGDLYNIRGDLNEELAAELAGKYYEMWEEGVADVDMLALYFSLSHEDSPVAQRDENQNIIPVTNEKVMSMLEKGGETVKQAREFLKERFEGNVMQFLSKDRELSASERRAILTGGGTTSPLPIPAFPDSEGKVKIGTNLGYDNQGKQVETPVEIKGLPKGTIVYPIGNRHVAVTPKGRVAYYDNKTGESLSSMGDLTKEDNLNFRIIMGTVDDLREKAVENFSEELQKKIEGISESPEIVDALFDADEELLEKLNDDSLKELVDGLIAFGTVPSTEELNATIKELIDNQ